MKKKYKPIVAILLALGVCASLAFFLSARDIAILSPSGTIARQQRDLLVFGSLLSLLVVLPVFAMTFWIVWKYRDGRKSKKKVKYAPEWDHNHLAETIWWVVPTLLIIVLSVVAWRTSHSLDPFKPLDSDKKAVQVQVVALPWKWLFIYPEQNIATVNYVQFPEDTPVTFTLTSDAPMNSFWIPKLGGQVYAMSGMSTKLHLEASDIGEYKGSSANISGEGFAGMQFTAKATSQADFDRWVQATQEGPDELSLIAYNNLAQPSKNVPWAAYSSVEHDLYNTIVMKYMTPGMQHTPVDESVPHEH